MTISEADAISSARSFANLRGDPAWEDSSISVSVEAIDGRQAFVVKAKEAPLPDKPAWMQADWAPTCYFVDRADGNVFGFANERVRTILR